MQRLTGSVGGRMSRRICKVDSTMSKSSCNFAMLRALVARRVLTRVVELAAKGLVDGLGKEATFVRVLLAEKNGSR